MKVLDLWMKFTLRFVAGFNVLAGLHMIVMYHETYKAIGMNKPDLHFPIQLVGILVALFGVGYLMVASRPLENRNLLLLGFLSKFFGSVLGTGYVLLGKMPPVFMVILLFSDIVYLPFFWIILRRVYRIAGERAL